MAEYWESKFKKEGALWKFYPSESAIQALEMFNSNGIKNILIPGFGYGRNAKLFLDSGFDVTGIEISASAIEIARSTGITCPIYNATVTSMPLDEKIYDGVFCYALIHLLNHHERKALINSCYSQLKMGGLMIFTLASTEMDIYGNGKFLSRNRYQIPGGLKVFFYDDDSIQDEFSGFGLVEARTILEPVKYMAGYEPLKLKYLVCKK